MLINEFLMGLAAFLGTYLIHSTVLLGGVLLLHVTKLSGTATLESLYRTAMVAPVLTAALSISLPVEPVTGTIAWYETREEIVRETGPATAGITREQLGGSERSRPAANRASRFAMPPEPVPVAPRSSAGEVAGNRDSYSVVTFSGMREFAGFLAAAWLFVALLTASRWLKAARDGRRLLAGRRPLASGPAHEALLRLTQRTGTAVPVLSVCDELGGPATLPGGEISLPGWAMDIPAAQLEAMLAHELAHVERRDPRWLATAMALEALFWLQPLNRVARYRLAGLAELHADARAARLTGNGRALARCLAHCAERMRVERMPVLAAAMARRGGALSERVRKLIEHATETGDVPMSKKFLIFTGAMALVMVLPSVAVLAGKSEHGHGTTVNIHETDDGTRIMSLSFSDRDMRLKLRASGDFVFAPDDSGLEYMGPGAGLEVSQEVGGTERRLVAEGAGDGIAYTFYVDGKERPFDAEARSWFANILPMVMRETAINAPERVEYILENDGHDGVLDEISRIRSDFARRRYVEAYVATGALPANAYDRLLVEVAKTGSDFEMRNALGAIHDTQGPRGEQLADLIAVAGGIGSDFELRQLLSGLSGDEMADDAVVVAYAEAAKSIDSDFELRQALETLAGNGENPTAVEMALAISHKIGSDFEMRSLLEKVAAEAAGDEHLAGVWLEAAAGIGSDFELRWALSEFARAQPVSAPTWQALFETAKGIGSDHECASFLLEAADHMPDDTAVESAFRSVLETIGSDGEYRRVARAIGE